MRRLYRSRAESGKLAIGLGWFSIAVGIAEILAGRKIARVLGIEHRTGLIRLFGLREIVNGIGILASAHTRPWILARVAGDLLDLGVLASGLSPRNRRRDKAAFAAASVFGITLLDAATGAMQTSNSKSKRIR